ncbi:ABC transporter permease [Rhodococcus spongiicola]|uniref:ABC transporter permease n=1 Tax=Rhodococcus spongiicola TaxID=2487352 RepID=A0A438B661_9NOCA|nr:ABC transporter permease [Rhodococcus spongiicola]RVW06445.1 ABC transporter permease [Rhodococcus spongiicola]
MSLFEYISDNALRLAFLTQQHIELVLLSVAISAAIAIPLAFIGERWPVVRNVMLSTTATMLTIPSFALFALMIPVLGLGIAPTIAALVMFGMFPILRNTITGIESVDPAVVDSARGLGMDGRRRMLTVIVPLAWPVILNGIRTATIMLVATAAIGAAVRGPGLGELIFRGLSRMGGANALNEALAGVLAIALVALVLDLVFLAISKLTTPRGINV